MAAAEMDIGRQSQLKKFGQAENPPKISFDWYK
jgi:hypothetical protein